MSLKSILQKGDEEEEKKSISHITKWIPAFYNRHSFFISACFGKDGTLDHSDHHAHASLIKHRTFRSHRGDVGGGPWETDRGGEGRGSEVAREGRSAPAIRAANKEQIELLMTGSRVPIDEPVKRQPHDHLHTRDNTPRETMRLNFLAGWSTPARSTAPRPALLLRHSPTPPTPSPMLPPPGAYLWFNLKRA